MEQPGAPYPHPTFPISTEEICVPPLKAKEGHAGGREVHDRAGPSCWKRCSERHQLRSPPQPSHCCSRRSPPASRWWSTSGWAHTARRAFQESSPFATYLTLAPLIGPETAYKAASGAGGGAELSLTAPL